MVEFNEFILHLKLTSKNETALNGGEQTLKMQFDLDSSVDILLIPVQCLSVTY